MKSASSNSFKNRRCRAPLSALWLLWALFATVADANVLDVTVNGNGRVTDAATGIDCDQSGEPSCQFDSGTSDITANLTAVPAGGWEFDGWGGDCASAGTNPRCTLLVAGDPAGGNTVQSVSATFSPASATLFVTLSGSGSGRVTSDPGIDCPDDCAQAYPLNTQVTLSAITTSQTSVFLGWEGGGCSGTGTCTLAMDDDVFVQAIFENDSDGDGVFDPDDACPNTPPGEQVDANGCSPSQLDDDGDGIANDRDQCPSTPPGALVDDNGCSSSQLDDDGDGVSNDRDQCPDTPPGAEVDADGCIISQLEDDDGDGVDNDIDQCPNTPEGAAVDEEGCSEGQRDSDGDGVNDALDACPGTEEGAIIDDDGCAETQLFGNELGQLAGLGRSQQLLGGRLDDICPRLVEEGDAGNLTDAQQELREACSNLKNRETSESQAATALDEALNSQLPALQDYFVELTQSQFRQLRNRFRERRSGGGGGVSVSGLNVRVGDETVPAAAMQSVFEGLLGAGASEEAFADFGKLGLFLQGDIDTGDRDADGDETAYDFDTWNLMIGGDYRFSDSFFAGASISYGEVDVDYDAGRGESEVEQWAVSLYGGWQITERWFLDGMFSYGESDFDLERNVSYVDVGGEFDSTHAGDTDGDQLFFGLNTGYTWNRGGWRFGPVATLTYIDGSIDGYTETSSAGSEAWNFIVDDREVESLRFSAGAQLDYAINTRFGVLVPGLRVSYVIETEDDDETINLRLANNPFEESTLSSDRIVVDVEARDDAFIDASFNLSAQFQMGVSGFFSYNFYSAYDNFSKDAYTIGVRWDKPF